MCYQCVERVLRAILYSAMKMAIFYSLYTWLIYSTLELPLVVIPTCLAGAMALVPIIDPIFVAGVAPLYVAFTHPELRWSVHCLGWILANGVVWWNVTWAIYTEIPESNPWLTGLGVALGLAQFGLKGIVIGPVGRNVYGRRGS